MAEIRNLTRNGETFYPLTCTDAVVDRDGNPLEIVNDIFDISEYNASGTPPTLAKYSTLALALAAVPQSKQKGGMTIRYVQSSDNKYVQYRLMSDEWSNNTNDWRCLYNFELEETDNDFSIDDQKGYSVIIVKDGHIQTKNFDSSITANQISDIQAYLNRLFVEEQEGDFSIKDEKDYEIILVKDGHIQTKNFDSNNIIKDFRDSSADLALKDRHDMAVLLVENGHILTKNFSSKALVEQVEEIAEESKNLPVYANTFWKGRYMAWYGTSIPAGGYPQKVGELLHATVYNKAVGGSTAKRVPRHRTDYTHSMRHLGNYISDQIDLIEDCWTIDFEHQTFTDGPRTIGMTDIPNITTWAQLKNQVVLILGMSFEICLISNFLLSNTEEDEAFLLEKLGTDYYNMLIDRSELRFIHDMNAFVFDHSNNDGSWSESQIGQYDINTGVGALETYFKLIYRYKPHARIFIVTNYYDWPSSPEDVNTVLRKLGETWQFPVLNLDLALPFGLNTPKVLTRGYWSNRYWHDEGFVWEFDEDADTYNTNYGGALLSDRGRGYDDMSGATFPTSYQIAKQKLNPQQIDGVWYWEAPQCYIWFSDGLHPGTDRSGNANMFYAETLAGMFLDYSTGHYYNNI